MVRNRLRLAIFDIFGRWLYDYLADFITKPSSHREYTQKPWFLIGNLDMFLDILYGKDGIFLDTDWSWAPKHPMGFSNLNSWWILEQFQDSDQFNEMEIDLHGIESGFKHWKAAQPYLGAASQLPSYSISGQ